MTFQNKLAAYAIDFVSYMIQKTKNKNSIKHVILFGSVAREEAVKESDVDIFIDVVKEKNNLEKEFRTCLEDFTNSAKYKNYWKLLDIENEIQLTIGALSHWKELKTSILANGIVLYGKYMPAIKEGHHMIFFIWENIKTDSIRVLFSKQLLGYNQRGTHYNGLLQKYNGEKLGKGCIIVPLEHSIVFHNLFKKYKISVKIKKVLEY